MAERIRMNSEDLQKTFPAVYREFFSQCEIVTSCQRSLPWAGGYVFVHGGLGVAQSIPLKTYVGLKPNDSNRMRFASMMTFVPYRGEFHAVSLEPLIQNRLETYLNGEFLKSYGFDKRGIDIHLLTEIPFGYGLNSTGAFTGALATALLLLFGKINAAQISEWTTKTTRELLEQKNLLFDLVLKTAWKLEYFVYNGHFVSLGTLSALINSRYPLAVFVARDFEKEKQLTEPSRWLDYIDGLEGWGAKFNELIKTKPLSVWPFHFGLIYSGESKYSVSVLDSLQDVEEALSGVGGFVQQTLEKDILLWAQAQQIIRTLHQVADNSNGLWERFLSIQQSFNVMNFKTLLEVYRKGFSQHSLERLFDSLTKEYFLNNVLNLSSAKLNKIYVELSDYAKKLDIESGFGAKIAGVGKRGDLLFAVADSAFCDSIDDCLESMRATVGKNVWLDYASWIDGYGEEGVTVEQHLREKISSSLIEPGSRFLKVWKGKQSYTSVLTPTQLEEKRLSADIFLDAADHKIYVKGRALDSDDLYSAKETIEVLQLLLARLDQTVTPVDIGDSPYADRTSMQGKIIGPLLQATQKYLNKKLPLIISGGLRKNYTLKLRPSDTEVVLLENL